MKRKYRNNFKKILEQKNISRYKIEKAIETDRHAINRIYYNKCDRIDLKLITKICDYLNVNLSDIIDYRY